MAEQSQLEDVIPHGEAIVERFGGIRPMAAKLDVPVTTVQGWKKRDAIPANRRDEIVSAASQYNISLKGLISSESIANQNARSTTSMIEEDPALRQASTAPQAQQSRPVQQAAPRSEYAGIDLSQVRRTARKTSFLTTASIVAVLAIAGAFLFGGNANQGPRVSSLETRVSNIEGQMGNRTPGAMQQGLDALRGRVDALTDVVAGSAEDLSRVAETVTSGGSLMQRLAQLEAQLAANPGGQSLQGMVQRMENMAALPEGSGQIQNAIDDLRSVVAGLQGRVDGLDVALADAKTQSDALAMTLSDVTGRDLSAAAMLLALTQVRQAADRQTPFTEDLALLRQIAAGTDPELAASVDRMAPFAESGVLSADGLKKELQGLSNEIITAKLTGEDVSLKDRVTARLQGLFSVRKDGMPVAGGAERDLIAQASAQLDRNDVAGAMATLQQLEGPAAEAAQPWQQQATATLAMQAIDKQLVENLIAKVRGLTSNITSGAAGSSAPINLAPRQPQPVSPVAPAQPQVQQQPAPQAVPQAVTPAPQVITPQGVTPNAAPQQPSITIQQ